MIPPLYDLSIYAAKTVIVLAFLMLMLRLLGKRQSGQMNVYDLVTIAAVSNSVQNAMTGGRGELGIGLICSTALVISAWGLTRLFVRIPRSQRLLMGVPVVLLTDGVVQDARLRREHISHEELMSVIRQHGLRGPHEVSIAVLELDGSISIVPLHVGRKVDTDLLD